MWQHEFLKKLKIPAGIFTFFSVHIVTTSFPSFWTKLTCFEWNFRPFSVRKYRIMAFPMQNVCKLNETVHSIACTYSFLNFRTFLTVLIVTKGFRNFWSRLTRFDWKVNETGLNVHIPPWIFGHFWLFSLWQRIFGISDQNWLGLTEKWMKLS